MSAHPSHDEQTRIDALAKARLAEQLRPQGRAPDSYSDDEYRRAFESVAASGAADPWERDDVIARAIDEGKILAAHADVYRHDWEVDPDATRALLAGLNPHREWIVGKDVRPDDRSFELHLATVDLLREAGLGRCDWTEDLYAVALETVTEVADTHATGPLRAVVAVCEQTDLTVVAEGDRIAEAERYLGRARDVSRWLARASDEQGG
jgi:hypothetical protein